VVGVAPKQGPTVGLSDQQNLLMELIFQESFEVHFLYLYLGFWDEMKLNFFPCRKNLKDNEVNLESRQGIQFQNFKLLKDELKKLLKKLPPTFYFDGELYTDKFDFEMLSGLTRLHEDKIQKPHIELINQIEYHIYDFVDTNELQLTYHDRYQFLKDFFSTHPSTLCINVETFLVKDLNDIKQYHDAFIKEGYEGIMIRAMDGVYELNKRSKFLQKFKEFEDDEFKIIGYSEGTGSEKGCIIWKCITKDGKEFDVRPRGTFESRQKLFEEGDKYIGKMLTVIFFEYTADGIPRFPVGKAIREIK
jgi:DNA ligase-1